jgi:hypothetical protein
LKKFRYAEFINIYQSVPDSRLLDHQKHVIHYNMALFCISGNLFQKAKEFLLETVATLPNSNPQTCLAYFKISEVCFRMKDWASANKYVISAISVPAINLSILRSSIIALLKIDHSGDAILVFDVIDYPILYCEVGIVLNMKWKLNYANELLFNCREKMYREVCYHADIGLRLGDKEPYLSLAHFELAIKNISANGFKECENANAVIYKLGEPDLLTRIC